MTFLRSLQAKLDRLVDLLAEGVLPPEDYRHKREQLKKRQHDLVSLIHAYDDADNMFGSTMEKLMKVAMGAHKAFLSSNVEEKRELLNFVFSNLSLKGESLCYSYNFPFNNFENLDDCSKWRCRKYAPLPSPVQFRCLGEKYRVFVKIYRETSLPIAPHRLA